ncbi:TPA: ATP synthase F0 subunit A [Candidatus Saccharibacteria bacterium]|nr:ATP synthase F0 subunit A [Candidatus Saccharibacteria bacterium]HRK41072.1 F0F1 ATP synthase subunit A [Candidatus Saccharibacteria bacterium]
MEVVVFDVFASSVGIPLAAEPVTDFFGLHITNSMIYGLIMAVIVVSLFTWAARRSSARPTSKFAFAVESLVEFVIGLGEDNFGSREKSLKYMPLLLTLFTFILFSNLCALIPGVSTINVATAEGQVPLLRAFTADLNATLAMAILTIGTVQVAAISARGFGGHAKHYFTLVSKNPFNPTNIFIGLIEVMGEFIRIMTLSMRLFGVIYAGEVLIHVVGELAGNFGWAATVPIYFMEIFFSCIQAYLFMMLAMVYIAMATTTEHDDHPEDHSEKDPVTPQRVSQAT